MARKKTPPPVPAAPLPPRREVAKPTWYTKDYVFGYPHRYTMRQIVACDEWALPPFQRDLVWSPEQQAAFCNTVFQGLPTAQCLVWRRYVAGKHVSLVLDGQQRLAAVGAPVRRHDGTVNPPPRAYFDLATGRFGTDPGRWALTMADIAVFRGCDHLRTSDELEAAGDLEGHDLWHAKIYANDVAGGRDLTFFVIDENATPEYVVESFRAINRPGVPFDQAEVERLVQAAVDFK
jgi:hypothetical protein